LLGSWAQPKSHTFCQPHVFFCSLPALRTLEWNPVATYFPAPCPSSYPAGQRDPHALLAHFWWPLQVPFSGTTTFPDCSCQGHRATAATTKLIRHSWHLRQSQSRGAHSAGGCRIF
jgi:hypothetical protein